MQDVKVPLSNMLLGEGRGFEIAQGRLGPGRLHHCMRLIGMGERAMELMGRRALQRVAFGKAIAQHGSFASDFARCRVELTAARLTVLDAAHALDRLGNKRVNFLPLNACGLIRNVQRGELRVAHQVTCSPFYDPDEDIGDVSAGTRALCAYRRRRFVRVPFDCRKVLSLSAGA